MKIVKLSLIVFVLVLLNLFIINCSSVPTADNAEIASVKKSFDTLSQAIVDGKLETVYSLVSAGYKTKQSYENLVKEYNENRDYLVMDFRNAVLLIVAVEKNQATARVKFGTGDEKIIDFIKEDNTWKWNLGGGKRIRNSP